MLAARTRLGLKQAARNLLRSLFSGVERQIILRPLKEVHDTQQAEIFNLLSPEEREAWLRIIASSKNRT